MQLPRITYTLNGTTRIVSDLTLGLASILLVTEREDGQQFYRTKWKGDITFSGEDYDLFWLAAGKVCCQPVGINLYRSGGTCSDQTPYWRGVFNLSDLEFNADTRLVKLKEPPRPDDGYQTLIELWETPVNWMKIEPLASIYSTDRKILYRRGRLLTQVLAGLTRLTLERTPGRGLIPTVGTHPISTFLEHAINPVDRTPNILQGAICLQAADVLAPGSPKGPAPQTGFTTKAETSLREFTDDLRELLCLYPYIDPATGKLRWEHESFFPQLAYAAPAVVFSLPDSNPAWNGHRIVKTSTDDLYGHYKLTISPNVSLASGDKIDPLKSDEDDPRIPLDFNKAQIDFTDACVTRLNERPLYQERTVSHLATHIDASRWHSTNVNKKEWIFLVLAEPSRDPTSQIPQIPMGTLDTFGVQAENGNLSASSVLRRYHRHNKPFAAGYTNRDVFYSPTGQYLGMLSVSPVRRLSTVTIPYCCTDEPIALTGVFQTWLGDDAILIKAEHQVAKNLLVLELAHPAPCQVAAPAAFPPVQTPGNCQPRGTFLRSENRPVFTVENGIDLICAQYRNNVFADGDCGEYVVETQIFSGLC